MSRPSVLQPQPQYIFVNGNGDDEHTAKVNHAALLGYDPIQMIFDPDGRDKNERVVILMMRGERA